MSRERITTLDQATSALLQFSPPRMSSENYTLERMSKLMRHISNPEKHLHVIHVAGTSGKTSTSYFIRGLLEAAGQKTGLTVSPHIVAVNERVQISGVPLAEKLFVRYLNEFLMHVDSFDGTPTYFELVIAFALWVFAREKVDYAVVETGIGGLLDSTNVLNAPDKLCVLTAIGFDHTEILGTTLTRIASQKAGIIHRGNAAFSLPQAPEIMQVFLRRVQKVQGRLIVVEDGDEPLRLPLFQRENWRLARSVFGYLQKREGWKTISNGAVADVMRQTPPARFEVYHIGDKTVVLDGAHNPQKLRAFIDSLPPQMTRNATVLVSLSSGPSYKITECLEIIAPLARETVLTTFAVGQDVKLRRSVSLDELAESAQQAGCQVIHTYADAQTAFDHALGLANRFVIVTGSLYLASLVRPRLIEVTRPD